jgi:hypothetical protein
VLRRLVKKAFTARRIAQIEPWIRENAAELVAAMGEGEAEVIGGLAIPDPGKGTFLDLPFADITPPSTSARAEVSAVVDVTSNSIDGEPGCHIATSVEVFDQAGGRTSTSQEVSSLREDRNLAPVGASSSCFFECGFADASCPDDLSCWANPLDTKFLCCAARPLQGWSQVN